MFTDIHDGIKAVGLTIAASIIGIAFFPLVVGCWLVAVTLDGVVDLWGWLTSRFRIIPTNLTIKEA